MKHFEIQIQYEEDRNNVVSAMVNNGYSVHLEKRERRGQYLHFDYFVVVDDIPEFPAYWDPKRGTHD